MTQELRNYIIETGKEENVYEPDQNVSDEEILELLLESDTIYEEHSESHRWWEEWLNIVKIGDKYVGYLYARANRDESVQDLGYEFDINSVREYHLTVDIWKPLE